MIVSTNHDDCKCNHNDTNIYIVENKGNGRWTLKLTWDNAKDAQKIPGEYIAVATNTQGTTRATFRVDAKDEPVPVPPAPSSTTRDEPPRSKSVSTAFIARDYYNERFMPSIVIGYDCRQPPTDTKSPDRLPPHQPRRR